MAVTVVRQARTAGLIVFREGMAGVPAVIMRLVAVLFLVALVFRIRVTVRMAFRFFLVPMLVSHGLLSFPVHRRAVRRCLRMSVAFALIMKHLVFTIPA